MIAVPGTPNHRFDGFNPADLDEYGPPQTADMNAIISGFTGSYSFAGHWSETPDYLARRKRSQKYFLKRTTDEFRQAIYSEIDPKSSIYAIGPAKGQFGLMGNSGFADLEAMGEVIVKGPDYIMVKIR